MARTAPATDTVRRSTRSKAPTHAGAPVTAPQFNTPTANASAQTAMCQGRQRKSSSNSVRTNSQNSMALATEMPTSGD